MKSASTASTQQQAAVRAQAAKDATDYQEAIAGIDSVSDLLANRPMVDFILLAKGLDPRKVSDEFLKKIFASDLNDKKSFVNTQSDPRFAEIVASFNFDSKGNVARLAMMGPQKRDQFRETQANYLQQSLEQQQGDTNPGVRLALYFQRKAGKSRPHTTSWPTRRFRRCSGPPSICRIRWRRCRSISRPNSWTNS